MTTTADPGRPGGAICTLKKSPIDSRSVATGETRSIPYLGDAGGTDPTSQAMTSPAHPYACQVVRDPIKRQTGWTV